MLNVQTYLPIFNGFCGTLFECHCEDQYVADNNDFDNYEFDYVEWRKRVGETIAEEVETMCEEAGLDIKIQFEQVKSPREYNFTNDEIQVIMSMDEVVIQKLTQFLYDHKEAFSELIKERFSSYDGFYSRISNDFTDWVVNYMDVHDQNFATCLPIVIEFYLMIMSAADIDELVEELAYKDRVVEQMGIINYKQTHETFRVCRSSDTEISVSIMLGDNWIEDFVLQIDCMSDDVKGLLLHEIHKTMPDLKTYNFEEYFELISGRHGRFIPSFLADMIQNGTLKTNISQEDLIILKEPEHEDYWEVFNDLFDRKIKINKLVGRIEQDSDGSLIFVHDLA
jgi:hypothetical protein